MAKRQEQEPEVITDGEDTTYRHPAFATINVSRPSGHATLFGSELKHQNYVTLTINRAEKHRSLHRDWIFGKNPIVEIAMSEAQWAQFVSSSGMGSGTPCTLQYAPPADAGLEQVPSFPLHNFHQQFVDESEKRAKVLIAKTQEVIATLTAMVEAPGSIPKTELKKLVWNLKCEFGNLTSNTAFLHNMFKESMENIVESGKAELEAFAVNLVMNTGIEALAAAKPEMPALTLKTIDPQE
jgi:hypothetical protein